MSEQSDYASDQAFYSSIVHNLRNRGWSRIDAEDEALSLVELRREKREEAPHSPAQRDLADLNLTGE